MTFLRAGNFRGSLLRYSRAYGSQHQEAPKKTRIVSKLILAGSIATYGTYMYSNWQDAKNKEATTGVPAHKLALYRWLPVNGMTALAGKMAAIKVPEVLRTPVYGLYATLFGCNMTEAAESSYSHYPTFNDFFKRPLREGVRPVDAASDLVSPADGRILAMGRIEVPLAKKDGEPLVFPEQIKGVSYPLKDLVTADVYERLTRNAKNPIHYCTIYLSPGDYHRFHSPANWTQTLSPSRMSGEALSVAPFMMRAVKNLLCLNERAVLSGHWRHGAMTFIPVGATNVRSIKLEEKAEKSRASYGKGELVGMFEMGSTVVLLFHAPKNFSWTPQVGETIKMGQALGSVPKKYYLVNGWF